MATARLIAATVCVVLLLRSPALAVDEIVDESTNVASDNFTLASQGQIPTPSPEDVNPAVPVRFKMKSTAFAAAPCASAF